jgi:nucleoside-diphosphate-sugar epimerase
MHVIVALFMGLSHPIDSQGMQSIFVTGGTGVLGRAVIPLLASDGFRVWGLSRSPAKSSLLRRIGAEPVQADLFDRGAMNRATEHTSGILHLATKIPPVNHMRRPDAWVENDRVRSEGMRNLVEAAVANGADTVVYASVTRVYPDSGGRWLDATVAPAPAEILRSTLEAEHAVAEFSGGNRRGIVIRMAQFYGPESQHVQDELRLARWGFVAAFGSQESFHSTIWIPDAASAVVAALEGAPSGVYDAVDDRPLSNRDRIDSLAKALGRKRLVRLPAWAIEQTVGRQVAELFARSQRVSNQRLKDATRWRPAISTVREGFPLCITR